MRVLLVDDDRMLRRYLGALLRRWGATVVSAACAGEAAQRLRLQSFDLLLTDLHMGDHDAFWLLQEAPVPEHTRIVIMTGYAPVDVERRLRHYGVTAVLTKPFSPEELMDVLESSPSRGLAALVPLPAA
ncbi:MAG: response regulator [Lentisphaerae bacterium]|nr:response regulator [Lentisphaerota bacterium]